MQARDGLRQAASDHRRIVRTPVTLLDLRVRPRSATRAFNDLPSPVRRVSRAWVSGGRRPRGATEGASTRVPVQCADRREVVARREPNAAADRARKTPALMGGRRLRDGTDRSIVANVDGAVVGRAGVARHEGRFTRAAAPSGHTANDSTQNTGGRNKRPRRVARRMPPSLSGCRTDSRNGSTG